MKIFRARFRDGVIKNIYANDIKDLIAAIKGQHYIIITEIQRELLVEKKCATVYDTLDKNSQETLKKLKNQLLNMVPTNRAALDCVGKLNALIEALKELPHG